MINLGERKLKMNREEKNQNPLLKYWQIILFIGLTIFNVGYTVARLGEMITKEETTYRISNALRQFKSESEKKYVRIDQVPGLNESLRAINEKLDDLKRRLDKLDDKINYNKK